MPGAIGGQHGGEFVKKDGDHHYASCPMYAHLSFGSRNAKEINSQSWDITAGLRGKWECPCMPEPAIPAAKNRLPILTVTADSPEWQVMVLRER